MVCREGILYKGTLARNPRGSRCRRIDEDEISTPVACSFPFQHNGRKMTIFLKRETRSIVSDLSN
ncbi:UNVERIFIED_CONTAM: hypothetical protein NCL1_14076 [Trichonephila clavipes]